MLHVLGEPGTLAGSFQATIRQPRHGDAHSEESLSVSSVRLEPWNADPHYSALMLHGLKSIAKRERCK